MGRVEIRLHSRPRFSLPFEYRSGVNLQFTRAHLALELTAGHNFETADHLNVTRQLAFQLQLARRDVRIDLRVGPNDQEIAGLDLAAKAAVDFDR